MPRSQFSIFNLHFSFFIFHFSLLTIFFLSSCSNTKYLQNGEKLYTGVSVELIAQNPSSPIHKKARIKKLVESAIVPKPNAKLLGLRMKLWFYNIAGTPKGKGLRYFLRNKMGEPPVFLSKVDPGQVLKYIDAKLYNNGFFHGFSEYKIIDTGKKASIHYIAHIHPPYTIAKVVFPTDDDILNNTIRKTADKTLLLSGAQYNLENLNKERSRIDEALKDEGFFYFNPDYLKFFLDTNEHNNTVKLSLAVKPDAPDQARLVYHIENVYVYPDYSLKTDSTAPPKDTLMVDSAYYISGDKNFHPNSIMRAVFVKKNDVYQRKNHNMTLSRLMGLSVFKYVSVRFYNPDTLSGYLSGYVLLTPLPRRSFRTELDLLSKSNNFVGPSLSLSYRNRNAFHGAELLSMGLHGSFETQFYGQYKGLFSYEIGPQVDFVIPRFIVPFPLKKITGFFIPQTRITGGYDYLKRVQYFNLYSLKFTYGYKWKETIAKEHELNPVNIIFTQLTNPSQQFQQLMLTNPVLKKSFEEKFIAGLTYSYTYNQQVLPAKRLQFFFKGNAEFAGNALSLLTSGGKPNPEQPAKIAGSPYAQFARFELDFRTYYSRELKKNKLAGRLYAGLGRAYGNSTVLPYIRQFFSGGANSVRAFRARSLGPGSYYPPDSIRANFFLEQGGDIKLEANAEYRFYISGLFRGALFADAGNTWLVKDNPQVPGGTFSSKFISEIAAGTGLGLRIDANFFVLRLDLAFPIRKPWLAPGERWVINNLSFGRADWRRDNLILNIAIGYPF